MLTAAFDYTQSQLASIFYWIFNYFWQFLIDDKLHFYIQFAQTDDFKF